MRPILVATDFSPSSEGALDLAASIARLVGSELVVLHVDALPETAPLSPGARARRQHARTELDRTRQVLERRDVRARIYLRPGDPAREILHVATTQGVAAVVIGTRGGAVAEPGVLGSVADRVVREATLPVLVVPRREGAPAGATSLI